MAIDIYESYARNLIIGTYILSKNWHHPTVRRLSSIFLISFMWPLLTFSWTYQIIVTFFFFSEWKQSLKTERWYHISAVVRPRWHRPRSGSPDGTPKSRNDWRPPGLELFRRKWLRVKRPFTQGRGSLWKEQVQPTS